MSQRSCFSSVILLLLIYFIASCQGFTKRIVGGTRATFRHVRPLVYILIQTHDASSFPCTGTILASRWLLSAAHCFVGQNWNSTASVDSTTVYIGSSSAYPMLREMPLKVTRILVHKGWKGRGYDMRHDVALLKLEKVIEKNKYFPIQIAKAPRGNVKVVAVGYGQMSEEGAGAHYAMETKVVVQAFDTCQKKELGAVKQFLRDDLQICATSVGFPYAGVTDTCYGDSGGPLFYIGGTKMRQFAITSFANATCAEVGATPWYTRVSYYEEAFKKIMKTGIASKGGFRALSR